MFSRRHRFHGYNSLRTVYQHGKSVRGPLLSLKFAQREAGRPYRVAVVVSRKVHKSAVIRNRIRRRVYEGVRRSDSQIGGGTDLVFTVFSDQAAELPAAKLQKIIDDLLTKTT
jgi:ribonuclease P protein component